MIDTDLNAERRHAWLRQEQQPEVKQQTPQSNFEQSPYWRFCFCVALIVIGIQVFSPEPAQSSTTPAHPAIQSGHLASTV